MLSNNMLRNLSTSYGKMNTLNNQLLTGKKVSRPSDDPVVAMKGIGYRMQVDKVEQYQRNLGEVNNWLDSSDSALDAVGQALHRTKELVTKAASDTLTEDDREKIKVELNQLREQIQDLANTKNGDKYLFSGTKTSTPLYGENGYPTGDLTGFDKDIDIEIFNGVSMKVNTNTMEMFKNIDDMFAGMEDDDFDFDAAITAVDSNMDKVLTTRADIGARQNRVEMMTSRLSAQEGAAKKMMSENEDVDYEKAITDMLTQEAIHRVALSVGARIIQPSLVDFLR